MPEHEKCGYGAYIGLKLEEARESTRLCWYNRTFRLP